MNNNNNYNNNSIIVNDKFIKKKLTYHCNLLASGVLGDSLGTLRNGMFG